MKRLMVLVVFAVKGFNYYYADDIKVDADFIRLSAAGCSDTVIDRSLVEHFVVWPNEEQ